MNTNPLKDGDRSENADGPGIPTLKKIRDRAIHLAWVNGRRASDLKPSDYVEAKRDLMGETDNDSRPAIPKPAPESDSPDPVSGPAGEDEDDEGRGDNKTSGETGVVDAGQDQGDHSAGAGVKKDE